MTEQPDQEQSLEGMNKDAYDQIAGIYSHFNYDSDIRDHMGKLPTINEETAILDLGCGPGNNIRFFAESNPRRIVGIDISEGMIQTASTNLIGLDNVELVRTAYADYEPDDSFDLVIANLSFVHVPPEELPDVLRMVASSLRPEGVVFANYFEGDDQVKLMKSKWGVDKKSRIPIERKFAFHSEDFLREAYANSGLEIDSLVREQPSPNALTRLHITAHKTS